MYRIILAAIAFVIFATPSYAWIRVSLEECFQAMERGTLIKAYTNSDWDTQHLWFYYNRSLYDFYYYRTIGNPARAICERQSFIAREY